MRYPENEYSGRAYPTTHMYGIEPHGKMTASYERGRSPVTGRYISRGDGYSGHSINDRDINAALNILSKYVTSQSIVGWELTENTNACGEPRSSVKQENELTSAF